MCLHWFDWDCPSVAITTRFRCSDPRAISILSVGPEGRIETNEPIRIENWNEWNGKERNRSVTIIPHDTKMCHNVTCGKNGKFVAKNANVQWARLALTYSICIIYILYLMPLTLKQLTSTMNHILVIFMTHSYESTVSRKSLLKSQKYRGSHIRPSIINVT